MENEISLLVIRQGNAGGILYIAERDRFVVHLGYSTEGSALLKLCHNESGDHED